MTISDELRSLIVDNPDIGDYVDQSLRSAAKVNPDSHTNPAQNREQYYTYLDEAVKLIPMEILNNPPDLIRDQILQSICYFYFLVDQEIPALEDKGFFRASLQYEPRFSSFLNSFVNQWGQFLDTPESWSEEQYQQFYKDPEFRLDTGDYEDKSNWNTFNRFFQRYLSDPSRRPVSSDSEVVVTSPADSVPQGVWKIDADSNIQVDGGLKIKNARFFNVNDLLGKNLLPYHDKFANGILTHTFLNVFDYHRYHFPAGGQVEAVDTTLHQNVALEVTWDEEHKIYDPVDSTGWQFSQTRSVCIIQTEHSGLCALIPMGMGPVSSCNLETYVKKGYKAKKGTGLGYFLFGGSDFIMLFQSDAEFKITAPQAKKPYDLFPLRGLNGTPFKHILVGAEYGRIQLQETK